MNVVAITQNRRELIYMGKQKEKSSAESVRNIVVGVITGLIVLAIPTLFNMYTEIKLCGEKLISIDDQLQSLEKTIEDKQSETTQYINGQYDGLVARMDDLQSRMNTLELANIVAMKVSFSNALSLDAEISTETVASPICLSAPKYTDTDVIALDRDDNTKEYTLSDLANKKILTAYESAGKRILFYGQLDEKGCWTGNCILNVYQDDQLILVNEVQYHSGQALSYRQVIVNNAEWIVSDRICVGGYNEGETYRYNTADSFEMDFSFYDAQDDDIYTYEEFLQKVDGQTISSYYHGNTANGKYADSTGGAYLIKFDESGYVKYLYCGNFVNGFPADETGNAWDIAKEKDTAYMYTKGYFTGDDKKEIVFKNDLSMEDIQSILERENFMCPLDLQWNFL